MHALGSRLACVFAHKRRHREATRRVEALKQVGKQARGRLQTPSRGQQAMGDVAAHMLSLLHQAHAKHERPADGSFVPLSLTLACLLQQLPPGLAPPPGVLSLHQLDRLPEPVLAHKLHALLYSHESDPRKALAFVGALVQYVRVARALLRVCHEHTSSERSTLDATQHVIGIVVDALGGDEELEQEHSDDESVASSDLPAKTREQDEERIKGDVSAQAKRGEADTEHTTPSSASSPPATLATTTAPVTGPSASATASTPALAVNPSAVMKRAVTRDAGDGSAVVEIMRKYPSDERIQTRGVRALRTLVRQQQQQQHTDTNRASVVAAPETAATGLRRPQRKRQSVRKATRARASSEASSASDSDSSSSESPALDAAHVHRSEPIECVIASMQRHAHNLSLQHDALLCLSEFVRSREREQVAVVTTRGGIAAIVDAMARLPDDLGANVGGLSVLAHPQIAGAAVRLCVCCSCGSERSELRVLGVLSLGRGAQSLADHLALARCCAAARSRSRSRRVVGARGSREPSPRALDHEALPTERASPRPELPRARQPERAPPYVIEAHALRSNGQQ